MTVLTVTLHPAVDVVLRGPRLRPDDAMRTNVELKICGGKGNNAARALARLGVAVTATGYQGGYSGEFAASQLASEGVTTAFVPCSRPTRTSTIVHEEETGLTYAIYEPGQWVDEDEVQALTDCFEHLLASHRLVLLCGSGQTDILAPLYARFIEIARRSGVRCLLDSSGPALTLGIQARPYLVKSNMEELSGYLRRDLVTLADQSEAISALCKTGIQIAAVSDGANGLLATNGTESWRGIIRLEHVVNIVGCGDALLAGMARAVLDGLPLPEIVRWGVACGAANTQVEGAGRIDRSTVERLLPDVQLEKV